MPKRVDLLHGKLLISGSRVQLLWPQRQRIDTSVTPDLEGLLSVVSRLPHPGSFSPMKDGTDEMHVDKTETWASTDVREGSKEKLLVSARGRRLFGLFKNPLAD